MKKHSLLIVLFKDLANGYLVFGRGVVLVREDLREGAERRLVEGKGRGGGEGFKSTHSSERLWFV